MNLLGVRSSQPTVKIVGSGKEQTKILAALYLFNLFLDLIIGFLFRFRGSEALLEADEREYLIIARTLFNGAADLSPRRSLGFPAFEAAVHLLTRDLIFLQCVITVVYALSAPLLFILMKRLTNNSRIAFLSGLALCVWPPAVYFGISLYSESLALPLLLTCLIFLPIGSRIKPASENSLLLAFISGLFLALATHVRPMYLLFVLCLLLIILFEEKRLSIAAGRFALALAGFGVLIAPWSTFMTARYHHIIIVTSNGGETLAGGLNPKLFDTEPKPIISLSDRKAWVGPGKWLPIEQTGYLSAKEQLLPYDVIDGVLKKRTLQWVMSHPSDAVYLEFSKLKYMWGFSFDTKSNLPQFLLGSLPTFILLFAALTFWIFIPAIRFRYARLLVLPLFVCGVALISWGSWRFRQVGDVGLIGFCVIGSLIAWNRRAWRSGRIDIQTSFSVTSCYSDLDDRVPEG